MHEDLRAKQESILHSKMPRDLILNSKKEQPPGKPSAEQDTTDQVIDVNKIPKKPKIANPSTWHPSLKEKLGEPLKTAG